MWEFENKVTELNQKFVAMEKAMSSMNSNSMNPLTGEISQIVREIVGSVLSTTMEQRFVALEKRIHKKEQVRKNERCLVVWSLPEKENDNSLTDYLNTELLPALKVPKQFKVVHFYRMGRQHDDGRGTDCPPGNFFQP